MSLYAICDMQILLQKKLTLLDFAHICIKNDVKIIQYQDEINNLHIQKDNLQYLKKKTNITIIINDKLELLKYCDGLHLSQENLKHIKNNELKFQSDEMIFKFLKKLYPNKLFGLSTHSEIEILHANTLELDYIQLDVYNQVQAENIQNVLSQKISYLAKISKHKVAIVKETKLDDNIKNISYNIISSNLYDN